MSRQSKNRNKAARAAEITRMHKSDQRGPKSTTPKHGKVKTAKWLAAANAAGMAAKALAAMNVGIPSADAKKPTRKAPPKGAPKK